MTEEVHYTRGKCSREPHRILTPRFIPRFYGCSLKREGGRRFFFSLSFTILLGAAQYFSPGSFERRAIIISSISSTEILYLLLSCDWFNNSLLLSFRNFPIGLYHASGKAHFPRHNKWLLLLCKKVRMGNAIIYIMQTWSEVRVTSYSHTSF